MQIKMISRMYGEARSRCWEMEEMQNLMARTRSVKEYQPVVWVGVTFMSLES